MPIIIHHDGVAPGQSAIGRTAHEHIDRPTWGHDTKPGDDPDVVLGVKGNGWVTGTGIDARWGCKDGSARQEARGPATATIGGSGEPDVGGPAIEEAAHL